MHVCNDLTEPMAPATYLRLRREAARYSIDQLARALVVAGSDPGARVTLAESRTRFRTARNLLALLERPGVTAMRDDTLRRIADIIPFDPAVYRQLAEEPADRHPSICTGCGCDPTNPSARRSSVCRQVAPGLCSHNAMRAGGSMAA